MPKGVRGPLRFKRNPWAVVVNRCWEPMWHIAAPGYNRTRTSLTVDPRTVKAICGYETGNQRRPVIWSAAVDPTTDDELCKNCERIAKEQENA